MTSFGPTDDLAGATFTDVDLSGARFVRSSLAQAVLRGADVDGLDIEAPWLLEGGSLVVNGVDVTAYVDGELDRRFPGRADRRAADPEALRQAWASLQVAWDRALDRAAAMPEGSVDVSVDGEWSFSQTVRHLVMATDVWLRQAVLGVEHPYHPLGQPHAEYETDGYDLSVFAGGAPSFDAVLEARADRVAQVRDFLADVTTDDLAVERRNPWAPQRPETTLSCLRTILEEEWEHLRYALRDLDALEALEARATG